MATILVAKIELFTYGYTRRFIDCAYIDIIQCLIRFFNGDEGIPSADDEITDNNIESIAEEHKMEYRRQQMNDILCGIPVQYFIPQNSIPTRPQFCIEMRNHHNVTKGIAIKAYKYVCKLRAHPEGIGSHENIQTAICGRYQWKCSSVRQDSKQNDDVKVNEAGLNGLKQVSKTKFLSKYLGAAAGNIFIAKQLIKDLRGVIQEKFHSESALCYYINIGVPLQINDDQMMKFTISMHNKEVKLSIINYDLHFKTTNKSLYGIIIPNDDIQHTQCLWKFSQYVTGDEIFDRFGIKLSELPQSSRQMSSFLKQLYIKPIIGKEMMTLIDDTDWFSVQQIVSFLDNAKSVTLSKELWRKQCKKSFLNDDLPFIPVVICSKKHWIEWVKIVYVETQNIYVGVSLKYDGLHREWSIQSICLDSDDIYSKHELVGLEYNYYDPICLFSLKKLKFVNMHDNNTQNNLRKNNHNTINNRSSIDS